MFLTVLMGFVLIIVCLIAAQWYMAISRMPLIVRESAGMDQTDHPSISVIIAAKEEAESIADTVDSLYDQYLAPWEIIVVNDRSEDDTGAVLERLKKTKYPNLRLIHIRELPSGWLGKNHALYQGWKASSGDWLLFADADIVFLPDALEKSFRFTMRKDLDHLALLPQNRGGTLPYRFFYTFWSIIGVWNFAAVGHAGVGAFNLMSRESYETAGTHRIIAMRPDDDIKLGGKIKAAGYRQQLGFGNGLIFIQWYDSLREMVRGLEKNLFAFMQYRVSMVIAASAGILALHVMPFVMLFSAEPARLLAAVTVGLYGLMFWINRSYFYHPWWYVITVPASAFVFLYCLWRSMWKTLRAGGVHWRGTTYSLKELRRRGRE
ncbi:glycosyltransferase [Alteribacter natronophilus]|uniref:glycosyltransferase n=1 Tax=Alteribacter natronophilus TaxID=2583810 RepID=UPI00110D493F|nr:glycosyltransferase family 2 protein [Alteribacter natronophilus]TMW70691.1 glycosyltransferase [Alteribacter natronophilus]